VNRSLPILVLVAASSVVSAANQYLETDQVIDLYCEGMNWASDEAKHIRVSLDRTNHIVSITDALREKPRVLKLVETPTMYKAHADHAAGYIDIDREKTPIASDDGRYCEPGQLCKAYAFYAVDFKLNRQSGKFEYLVVGEIREEGSNVLLKELNEWGIFRGTRCTKFEQKY
jgi:hypothetical protein